MPAIDLDDVRTAAQRIAGVPHRTPLLRSRTLDGVTGLRLALKAENLQRAGSFKLRGAFHRVSTLPADALAAGVCASSSGNHAQALALAAALCGTRATILMPRDAPASKRAATEGYGAEVIEFDRYADDRERLTAALAADRGLTLVHPYDDPFVMAGAGTVGLELVEDAGELDAVVVPTGGGGLLSGCATAVKGLSPGTRVVGVEPAASDDVARSLAAGERVRVKVGQTIADGQQLPTPGALTFEVIRALVDDVVTVSDDEIAAAMRFLFERLKVVVEPSGASGLAAVLAGRAGRPGERVGVVLSGGNVDAARFAALTSA
ncbi:MAG: threonine/serine dehydratase [Thermoleophilaceae bacterium]